MFNAIRNKMPLMWIFMVVYNVHCKFKLSVFLEMICSVGIFEEILNVSSDCSFRKDFIWIINLGRKYLTLLKFCRIVGQAIVRGNLKF